MANVVETKTFQCTELDKSDMAALDRSVAQQSNKFWRYTVYDNGELLVEYGKTGSSPQTSRKSFGNSGAALAEAHKKAAEKQRGKSSGGQTHSVYTEVKLVAPASGAVTTTTNVKADVKLVAEQQIRFRDAETKKLVDRLVATNQHDIVSNTKGVTINSDGVVTTPLGVVTRDTIVGARTTLNEIGRLVTLGNVGDVAFRKRVEEYMRQIPMDVGYGRVTAEGILGKMTQVQAQNQMLDALDASVDVLDARRKSAIVGDPKAPQQSVFDVDLELVDVKDPAFAMIEKMYTTTRSGMHQSAHLKVKRVFRVRIGHMATAFENDGAKLQNIWQLWHGTRTANLLSILAKGFMIPPANASYCTGRAFGNGAYFSEASSKSLNYAYGYWSGGARDNNCFMFVCDVAMGKYYTPTRTDNNLHEFCRKNGYDSTNAPGGGVFLNHEAIVYRTSQINPRFLVEFGP